MGTNVPADVQISIVPHLVHRITQIVLLGILHATGIVEVVACVGTGDGDAAELLPWRSLRNTNRGPRLVCLTILRLKRCWIVPDIFGDPTVDIVGVVIRHVPGITLPAVISFDMPENVVRRQHCVLGIAGSGQVLAGPGVQVHPVQHVVVTLWACLGIASGGVKRKAKRA